MSNRCSVRRVLERENTKWRLGAVPKAYLCNLTESVRVNEPFKDGIVTEGGFGGGGGHFSLVGSGGFRGGGGGFTGGGHQGRPDGSISGGGGGSFADKEAVFTHHTETVAKCKIDLIPGDAS